MTGIFLGRTSSESRSAGFEPRLLAGLSLWSVSPVGGVGVRFYAGLPSHLTLPRFFGNLPAGVGVGSCHID